MSTVEKTLETEIPRSTTLQEAARHKRLARLKLALAFLVPVLLFAPIVALTYFSVISDTVAHLLIVPMLAVGFFSVVMVFQSATHNDTYQDLRRKSNSY